MKVVSIILLILSLVSGTVLGQMTKTPQSKKTSKTTRKATPTKSDIAPKSALATPAKITAKTPANEFSTEAKAPAAVRELAKFEAEVLVELNLFRSNPKEYVKHLEIFLKTYDGSYFKTTEGIELISFEGKTPVIEVIEILKRTNNLPEFKLANGLVKAAADHAQDLVKNNKTGHRGTDGTFPDERAGRYGTSPAGVNENISYGAKNARDVVLTMLIDDGNANRNHRKNLLNPGLKTVGLATGKVEQVGLACVLVLAPSFIDKSK
jgi:uncharacterized protein YkwD